MSLCILASIIAFWKTGFTGIDDPYEPPVNGEVSLMSMPSHMVAPDNFIQ